MRRPINWLVFVINLAFLAIGLTFSRGGAEADQAADGMRCPAREATALESMLAPANRDCPVAGPFEGSAVTPAATTADFSMTYTVEDGVYELDPVRHDGNRLFVTNRSIDDRIFIVSRHAPREAVRVSGHPFDSQAGSAEIPELSWPTESTGDDADSPDRRLFAYLPDPQAIRFAVPVEVIDEPPAYFSSSGAFIDGDTVYYVGDGQLWSSSWASPSQVNGAF